VCARRRKHQQFLCTRIIVVAAVSCVIGGSGSRLVMGFFFKIFFLSKKYVYRSVVVLYYIMYTGPPRLADSFDTSRFTKSGFAKSTEPIYSLRRHRWKKNSRPYTALFIPLMYTIYIHTRIRYDMYNVYAVFLCHVWHVNRDLKMHNNNNNNMMVYLRYVRPQQQSNIYETPVFLFKSLRELCAR